MEQQEIAILGKIAAGMTHEMKNVLGIIKESNGLMRDILSLSREASFPHQDKFSKALDQIERHVGRGVEITTQLNKFAHSMDEPSAGVEVNELLGQVVFLMQRFARLKQVNLTAEPLDKAPILYTNPIRVILALSACVDYCLDLTAATGKIVLRPEKVDQKLAFQIVAYQGAQGRSETLPRLPDMGEGLRALGGELHPLTVPGQLGLSLVLPLKKE